MPDEIVAITLPGGKVALSAPARWRVNTQGNSATLFDPARAESALHVVVLEGLDPPTDGQVASETFLVHFVKQQHDAEITAHDVATAGMGDFTRSEYTLRTVRDEVPINWRIWTLARVPVVVFLTHVRGGHADPVADAEVEAAVRSTRLIVRPPPTREEFQTEIAGRLRAALPGRVIEKGPGFSVTAGDARLALDSLYRDLLAAPDRRHALVERAVALVVAPASGGAAPPDTFPAARTRLLPVLKPGKFLEESAHQGLVRVPLAGDVAVCFACEIGEVAMLVTDADAKKWAVDAGAIFEAARKNLEKRGASEFQVVEGESGGRALVCNTADGYAASRLVLPGLYDSLRRHLGDVFLAGVPTRDLLVAFTAEPASFREQVVKQIRDNHSRGQHSLSPSLFRLTRDGPVAAE